MKKLNLIFGLVILTLANTSSIGGNGNGPNSGNGGNTHNNGNGTSILIYHGHGNGTYSMMTVNAGSLAGHAAHGDMWYFTGCPLSGPEHCY